MKSPIRLLQQGSALAAVALVLDAIDAQACAACTGQSDSALAQGMNWGIMALLMVIGIVLSGVAGFFVFISKKNRNV
jgi:hypothetical protein